jgi:hypothetical protein
MPALPWQGLSIVMARGSGPSSTPQPIGPGKCLRKPTSSGITESPMEPAFDLIEGGW